MSEGDYRIPTHYRVQPPSAPTTDAGGWDAAIVRALETGHRFLPLAYGAGGALFRGACSGLQAALAEGTLGHYEDRSYHGDLERGLGMYLVSQDMSDAVSASRLWEMPDGYIAVFDSGYFNGELEAGRAAVMGFAEAGVVFRYPLLTRPLPLSRLQWLILPPCWAESLEAWREGRALGEGSGRGGRLAAVPGLLDRCVVLRPGEADRRAFNEALADWCRSAGLVSAASVECRRLPGRLRSTADCEGRGSRR